MSIIQTLFTDLCIAVKESLSSKLNYNVALMVLFASCIFYFLLGESTVDSQTMREAGDIAGHQFVLKWRMFYASGII